MTVFDRIVERARQNPARVVLMEGEDDRVVRAAQRIEDEGIARVTVTGFPPQVRERAAGLGILEPTFRIADPSDPELLERLAARLQALRAHKGLTLEQARKLAATPLYASVLLVVEARPMAASAVPCMPPPTWCGRRCRWRVSRRGSSRSRVSS